LSSAVSSRTSPQAYEAWSVGPEWGGFCLPRKHKLKRWNFKRPGLVSGPLDACLRVVGVACVLFLGVAVHGGGYPVTPSANGRYLVDQGGAPWLLRGDSPQGAFTDISSNTYVWFVRNRASSGLNALWIQLLSNDAMGGQGDGSLLDGTVPFTGTIGGQYDLSKPNPNYFKYIDWALGVAGTNGITVFLNPCEMIGWTTALRANSTNTCHLYGEYLGQRYKDVPNIVWFFGNDFQTWTTFSDDDRLLSIARGIRESDTNHLMTIMLDYPVSSSLNDSRWWGMVGLNCSYTYAATYQEVHHGYATTNLPVFQGEAHYEGENVMGAFGTPLILRMQEWWSATAGACGQLIGSINWNFASGWENYLNSAGTVQFKYLNDFLLVRRWWEMVPETNNLIVTSGYGTYNSGGGTGDSDYATTAWVTNGTLVVTYLPTRRQITVNMGKLSGTVTARWYDPSAGTYSAITGSPFPQQWQPEPDSSREQQRRRRRLGPGARDGANQHGAHDHEYCQSSDDNWPGGGPAWLRGWRPGDGGGEPDGERQFV
jgi:hypothetical protein